jgi:hypothetical protein
MQVRYAELTETRCILEFEDGMPRSGHSFHVFLFIPWVTHLPVANATSFLT